MQEVNCACNFEMDLSRLFEIFSCFIEISFQKVFSDSASYELKAAFVG